MRVADLPFVLIAALAAALVLIGFLRARRRKAHVGAGKRLDVTFLVVELPEFSTLVETLEPDAFAKVYDPYLELAEQTVGEHGGYLCEPEGGRLTAVFGAAQRLVNPAERALACAIALRDSISAQVLAGIHSGPALVGTFGSGERARFGALGRARELTAEIAAANRIFDTQIALSRTAVERIGDPRRFRPLGRFALDGETQGLEISELLSAERAASRYISAYRTGYEALELGDPNADAMFKWLADENPEDRCVAYHLGRLRAGIRTPTVEPLPTT
ncbi:MAG: adenylate/guanylate cyclase domain-containing protein [Candidatus Eremiobacteraeota bacterium]|nr:adenylate/guanylate cyclase domain-containing protein [Candidatus Eremiobacteraeota bacterium]